MDGFPELVLCYFLQGRVYCIWVMRNRVFGTCLDVVAQLINAADRVDGAEIGGT